MKKNIVIQFTIDLNRFIGWLQLAINLSAD